jgi:hypothetical protein
MLPVAICKSFQFDFGIASVEDFGEAGKQVFCEKG